MSHEYSTSLSQQIDGEQPSKLLVVRPKPKHDESYLGFLLRLTELNDYAATGWLRKLAGIPVAIPVGTQIGRIEADLPNLARLVDSDVSDVRCLLYEPVTYKYDARVLGSSRPPHVLRLYRPKVCPKCLKAQNYCRKLWDYTAATACPTHNVLLIDECSKCHKRITWSRKRVSICRCGIDFRQAEVSNINPKEAAVSRLILDVLEGSSKSRSVAVANPFSNLDLSSVLGALFFFAIQQESGERLVRSFPSLTVREAHNAMLNAFSVFEDWPNNFHAFLDEKCSTKSDYISTNNLFNRYGSIARQLYRVNYLPEPISGILRGEFEVHVTERWDEGRSQAPVWFSNHCGKYVTRKKAAAILNVSPQTIERLVREGKLSAKIGRNNVRQKFSVDAAEVDNLLSIYGRSLSMYEATRFLGLRPGHVKALSRRGLLTETSFEPDVRIDRASAQRLLESIIAKIKTPARSKERWRDFENVLERLSVRLSRQSWGIEDFVTDILSGQLTPKSTRMDRTGFRKLRFSASDVARYQRQKLKALDNYYVLEDKVSCGLRPGTVYFLARRGLITTKGTRKKGNATRIITRSAVQSFDDSHITARTIARIVGSSIPFIVNTLKAQGVYPVSGTSVDGGPMYIFRRTDIDDSRIDSIKVTPRVSRLRGLGPINSAEVAKILSLSVRDVEVLVANDVIRPYRDSPRSAVEYQFNRKYVEGFRNQFTISLTELLSSNAAAALLGMAQPSFRRTCIDSGYVKYEISKDGKKRFLRRCDVEKIAAFHETVIRETHVPNFLGVSRTFAERCRQKGLLSVVNNPYPKIFPRMPTRLYLRAEVARLRVIRGTNNRARSLVMERDS